MDIKGQKMLKVCGILMIIFGALAFIAAIMVVVGGSAISSFAGLAESPEGTAVVGMFGTVFIIIGIVAVIAAVLEVTTGIVGVQAAKMPSVKKIKAALILDIIIIVLSLVSIVYNLVTGGYAATPVFAIIISILAGLALPVLFLIGVIQYKNGLLELMGGAAE